MIRNIFKVMLRNLKKYKVFSAINILGLAIGMACCLLILMFVSDELSFDRYNALGDRIYRFNAHSTIGGTTRHFALTPAALAPAVKETIPEVLTYARLFNLGRAMFVYEGRNIDIPDFYGADEDYFKLFSHEFLAGDPATALQKPNSFVMTEDAARQVFKTTDALGKAVTIDLGPFMLDFMVTGVIRNVPKNTHLRFSMLMSTSTFRQPQFTQGPNGQPRRSMLDEFYAFGASSYVLVDKNVDLAALDRKVRDLVEARWGDFLRQRGVVRWYELRNLFDLHLKSYYEAEPGSPGNIQYVYLFGAIALLVLFIACFNFVNLSTARSTLRAKEVGLRKVFGAEKKQLIRQFLGESVLLSLLGMFIGILIVLTALPAFNAFTQKTFSRSEVFTPIVLAGLGLIILLTGLGAGAFPAFVLSSFDPVKTVRGKLGAGTKGQTLRKALVIVQFSIAVFMIIGIIVVVRQIDYMKNKDLGFNREMLVVVPVRGPNHDALKNRISQNPNVKSVSFDLTIPGQFTPDDTFVPEGRTQDDTIRTSSLTVGYDFLKTFEIELLAGRDFSPQFPSDAQEGLIINETTARELGWTAAEAIGKEMVDFTSDRNQSFRVIGVIRDFHHQSLRMAINPTCLKLNPNAFQYATARIGPANVSETLGFLEKTFKELFPRFEYRYFFVDDDFRQKYPNEEKVRSIYTYFGVLAVFVACLGLFGLASFIVERRTKEIGIRKALGAGVRRIVFLLSGEFIRAVLVANLIAWPLAFYVLNRWLRTFAYRISVAWWFFLLGGVLSVLVAFLTVSYQSVRSAQANPVDTLRYE
jgi:putative ABC transport system permease protein